MKHTIAYSLLPGFERIRVLAPMLPVNFIHGNNEFSTVALVDSGAERGLISTIIADELGIDWINLPQFTGYTASGSLTFRLFNNIEVEAFNTSFKMDVAIAEGISAFKCILGRRDLFKKAKIIFEGYSNQFHIEFRRLN